MKRSPTHGTEAELVRPSMRDPIAQWLDVFTSLLALPASEADRIRDELEDHLRTRVDDLLILGMTEPEAIQKAVTELGETAQLARNFRSVRTHSRRRIAMHTALFAAVGLAISVSVAGLIPRSGAPAHAPVSVVQPEETGLKSLGVDLNGGTLEETLRTIAEATGARLFVHWKAIEGYCQLTPDSEVGPIPAKNLDGPKIRQLLNSMLDLSGDSELTVRTEGDLLEVATRAYFDSIETVTREYSVENLVPAAHVLEFTAEGGLLIKNIEAIVEPECWKDNGGLSSLTLSGSLLSVRAPERIQTLVQDYLSTLEGAQRETDLRLQRERDAQEAQARAAQAHSLTGTEEAIAQHRSQLESLLGRLDEIGVEYWRNEYLRTEREAAYMSATDAQDRAHKLDELASAGSRLDSLRAHRDLLREQIATAHKNIEAMEHQLVYLRGVVESGESAAR